MVALCLADQCVKFTRCDVGLELAIPHSGVVLGEPLPKAGQVLLGKALHGSGPRRANQNPANPSGFLLGGIMMLVHIGQAEIAARVHNAWLRTLEEGIHTYDIFQEGVIIPPSKLIDAGKTNEEALAIFHRNSRYPDQSRGAGSDKALNQKQMGTAFLTQASNKRSLALDLKQERDREILKALVKTADVFVENDRRGPFEAAGLGVVGWWPLVVVFAAVALFMMYFFRDPSRTVPAGEGLIVSAADGRVTRIEENGDTKLVSVFLSPLGVHINRSPIAGTVRQIDYTGGRKMAPPSD